MRPLLIGHRGDAKNYPENSIAAFDSAFEKGLAGIELDVQERNGELIVVHNYMYDRSGIYPKLKDVLERYADKGRIEIEIKSLDFGFLEPLSQLLKNYQDLDIELTTSVTGLVHRLRSEFPDISLGLIFSDGDFEDWMVDEDFLNTKVVKSMELFEANVAHLPLRILNKELVDDLHTKKFKVHSHIKNQTMKKQVNDYQLICSLLVDQCTIDDPDIALHI